MKKERNNDNKKKAKSAYHAYFDSQTFFILLENEFTFKLVHMPSPVNWRSWDAFNRIHT